MVATYSCTDTIHNEKCVGGNLLHIHRPVPKLWKRMFFLSLSTTQVIPDSVSVCGKLFWKTMRFNTNLLTRCWQRYECLNVLSRALQWVVLSGDLFKHDTCKYSQPKGEERRLLLLWPVKGLHWIVSRHRNARYITRPIINVWLDHNLLLCLKVQGS